MRGMQEEEVFVTGNEAVARAVKLAKPNVIAAYPITPQTEIVEVLARYVESGELKSEYIHVESEHSAMAACIGAASMGARVFTATSSHGFLYMCEMIFWASIARLPIVMANVNRALGPGWNIWADLKDAMSHRDAGWIQFYTASVQEAYDTTLMAFRIAEDRRVMLPTMVNLEGFVLSHVMQPLRLVDEAEYDKFLPPVRIPHALNFERPHTLGTLISPEHNYLVQYDNNRCMRAADDVIAEVEREFERLSGRRYGAVMKYRCDDAETLVIAMGTLAKEAEVACDSLREKGEKIGVLRLRQLRPFPKAFLEEVKRLPAERFIIIDRAYSSGYGGILAEEVKAKLYDLGLKKEVKSIIAGLGGQDVPHEALEKMFMDKRGGEVWFGV